MFCGNCGKPLRDGDRFCDVCGAAQVTAVPVSAVPEVQPAPAYDPAPMYDPAPVQESAPVAEEPPKKKKGKKKKILAITAVVTVVALVLGVVGWLFRDEFFGSSEVIFVRTDARTYNTTGEVIEVKTWEYDDQGMILKHEMDIGQPISVWDAEAMVYTNQDGPADDIIDSFVTYEYDEKGNVAEIRYKQSVDSTEFAYRYDWEYEDDRIASVTMKDIGSRDFKSADTECLYTYDADGNLTHIYYESETVGQDMYMYKMAYDSEGRMTRLIKCDLEKDGIYDFSYDKEDRLSTYTYSIALPTRQSSQVDVEANEQYYAQVEYSDDGLLLSYGDEYTYKYEDDQLVKQESPAGTFSFTYNGDVPQDKDGKLFYDDNGCLIKQIHEDGTYTEYSYVELELSEEEALRYHRQQQIFVSTVRYYSEWPLLSSYDPLTYTLQMPLHPVLLVEPVTEFRR